MGPVIFNSLLYIILLFVLFRRNKRIGVAEILIGMYFLVAVCGAVYFSLEPYTRVFNYFNFLYLFFVVSVFVYPISNDRKLEVVNPVANNESLYKLVSWAYIVIAFFSCVVYIPIVINILQHPDWAELYAKAHEEEVESNLFTKVANLFFHVRYLGLVLFFVYLPIKKHLNFKVLLGIASFLPIILVTMMNASRGGIVALIISFLLTYKLFDTYLSKSNKKTIIRLAICSLPLFVVYFFSVSESRFSTGTTSYDSVENSIIAYMGQSMLSFNDEVMDKITGYANGGYMFNLASQLKNLKGGTFGSGFMTFVGCLYIDFGLFGTIIVSIIVCYVMMKISNKRIKGIPEYFILLTYLMHIFNGVFVVGRGYGAQWVEAIIIYLVLKSIQVKTKVCV